VRGRALRIQVTPPVFLASKCSAPGAKGVLLCLESPGVWRSAQHGTARHPFGAAPVHSVLLESAALLAQVPRAAADAHRRRRAPLAGSPLHHGAHGGRGVAAVGDGAVGAGGLRLRVRGAAGRHRREHVHGAAGAGWDASPALRRGEGSAWRWFGFGPSLLRFGSRRTRWRQKNAPTAPCALRCAQARHSYFASDIRWGRAFAGVLNRQASGLLRADFSHFDLTRVAAGGGGDDEEEGGGVGPGSGPLPAGAAGAGTHPRFSAAAAAGAAARMSGGAAVGAM